MRRSRNELRQMDLEEAEKTGRSAAKAEDAKRSAMAEIEKFHQKIMAEIKQLQDEKHEVYRSPPTKEELLKTLKAAVKARKDSVVRQHLRKHIEDCQKNSNAVPFDVSVLRRLYEGINLGRLIPLCITEKDVEKAVSELEEIGIMKRNVRIESGKSTKGSRSFTKSSKRNFKNRGNPPEQKCSGPPGVSEWRPLTCTGPSTTFKPRGAF